jgi:hypothetical protein
MVGRTVQTVETRYQKQDKSITPKEPEKEVIALFSSMYYHLPGIHLHMLGIKEEYGGWDPRDVKVLNITLYFFGIDIHKFNRSKFGHLPC